MRFAAGKSRQPTGWRGVRVVPCRTVRADVGIGPYGRYDIGAAARGVEDAAPYGRYDIGTAAARVWPPYANLFPVPRSLFPLPRFLFPVLLSPID